ncbi:MAG: hypothetical protein HQ546_03225, partial [Planctomycetes bacterium]|nr:hypothetical protein [Planctomycetota bacterium]
MLKKVILLVGTLMVLLGILAVYRQFTGFNFVNPAKVSVPAPPADQTMGIIDGVPVGAANRPTYYRVDKRTSRREALYTAEEWAPTGEDEYLLTKPRFELYFEDGQIVYISANTATLGADISGGTINLRKGTLLGDVRIKINRGNFRPEDQGQP